MFDDRYNTITAVSEGIYRDKGSKFIAYAYPFRKEQELKAILATLRAQHQKAKHFCWAFRLSPDRSLFRVNDDGEPSGTAGRPILNVLLSTDITDTLIVVVRYFGGTLLGVPGLITAYKTAASEALANADVVQKTLTDVYELSFNYVDMNEIMRVLKEERININTQQFDNECKLVFEVPKTNVNVTVSRIEKVSSAKLTYLQTI